MAQSPQPQNVAVLLRIGKGSFTEGFAVELQILEDGRIIDKHQNFPRLAAAPEIPQSYQVWKPTYDALGQAIGSRMIQPVIAQVTHQAILETCCSRTREFETIVRTWLTSSTFEMLRDRIQANVRVAADQSVSIILDCDTGDLEQDNLLRKLPWHTWNLFDQLNHAEIVLSARFARPTLPLQAPVRTLAIFGSAEGGLNLEEDNRALKELERDGSEIDTRLQPKREELSECLYNHDWDILFFAGHSFSDASCQTGAIQLQNGVTLALDDLREDLKRAIRNGLKLVIFNSCDGLGIARFIEKLSVEAGLRMPVMIVMREPVPDPVARKFLQYFLEKFFHGKPLYLAVREARSKLHWMQSDDKQPCPAATWLPIVCQNPNQPELVFPQPQPKPDPIEPQLGESQPQPESKIDQQQQRHPPRAKKLWRIVGLVGLGFTLVIVWQFLHPPTPPFQPIYNTLAEVPVPNGTFRYGGSTTWAPIRESVDPAIQQEKLDFKLHYVKQPSGDSPNTATGVEMLLQGQIDFSQASRLLPEETEYAQEQGVKLELSRPVAKSFKAIGVHHDLALNEKGLTLHQIKRICEGKITNWRDVGGPDLPIQVFVRNTPTLKKTLGDGCRGKNVVSFSTPSDGIQKLAQTPGGFYVNAASLLVPQCSIKTLPVENNSGNLVPPYKEPLVSPLKCPAQPNRVNVEAFKSGEYPQQLSDTLYVVFKKDDRRGQQAGVAYANLLRSREGQKLLEAAGFMGIR